MSICYFCGEEIEGESANDHVPPLSFFPRSLRRRFNLSQLITLPSHNTCNAAYGLDEEYFRVSVAVRAEKTFAGKHLWKDIGDKFRKGGNEKLAELIRSEFQNRTSSGIYFPPGLIAKRFDVQRIDRVIWKIVRGLFYHRYERVLSESTPHYCALYDDQQARPLEVNKFWNAMMVRECLGKYSGVFDYKMDQAADSPTAMHACCMLFWDSVPFYCIFHDPDCDCDLCEETRPNGRIKK